jgi:c-di-GMP-binding flagellar brake protein YcgR
MTGQRMSPTELDDYRITAAAEIQLLVQRLLDERALITLSGPQGDSHMTLLSHADATAGTLSLSADDGDARLDELIESGELTATAYLDRIKIQFDLDGVLQISAPRGRSLRAQWPQVVYRFQRREAFRVLPLSSHAPTAHLQHPTHPERELALRVLDVSLGGVALFLPDDVPMIPAGVKLPHCRLALDDMTSLDVTLVVHHVTAIHPQTRGVRLGCELLDLDRADRSLGTYINQTQKRRAALTLDRR